MSGIDHESYWSPPSKRPEFCSVCGRIKNPTPWWEETFCGDGACLICCIKKHGAHRIDTEARP